MEQGMDVKTLSVILGHASVAFTLDTYAHVLDDHKQAGMALMEDLFNIPEPVRVDVTYPVLVTPFPDGTMELTLPDFPEINCNTMNLPQGLSELRESLREELGVCFYPPQPTPVMNICCEPGQFVLQLSLCQ
jgi:hypothetical protein